MTRFFHNFCATAGEGTVGEFQLNYSFVSVSPFATYRRAKGEKKKITRSTPEHDRRTPTGDEVLVVCL